ncbi:MAG: helix-turn-helix domain-containing protein [Desulfuromonadales bacterium]|nr:helix-turn-helix domain-containing protein [Desulfuromonadales bacterium]
MTNPDSIQSPTLSAEALFRYQVVSEVLCRERSGLSRAQAVRATAAQDHQAFATTTRRRVSRRTLYRWLARFLDAGFDGLVPKERPRTADSTVLCPALLEYFTAEKRLDPAASIPELIRRAREQAIVEPGTVVDRTSVWRAFRRLGLPTRKCHLLGERDTRRFAYPHRMDMVLADGKHFRAGARRLRRVALFFLDDSTRYGLEVVVGTAESAHLFLTGLHEAIAHHGRMSCLFLDHGPGFIALDTTEVARRLDVHLIHGEVAYPQGHGKIERFNRRALAEVLRSLDGRPDVDPDCGALTLRLRHYLREVYNHSPHEGLDHATPALRWHADARALRFPASRQALRQLFVVHCDRHVSNDHIVSVDSIAYEVPRGHARQTVRIERHVLDGHLSMLHEGRLVRLHPVDLVKNAHDPRGKPTADEVPLRHPPRKTSAELAFAREFAPIVDPDGGFTDPK